jgi:aminoglycoside phosphotransferase (APT) family kinase protein
MAWIPERVVGPDLARSLIESQFPDLRPARVEPFGQGFDNTAYRVNGAWVFRFPRRQVAVALIEREPRLLPILAPSLPLQIPVPDRIGRGNEEFPWPFAGYREIPGQTACRASLSDAERAAAARPIGQFLKALHAFSIEEAARLGAPGDELERMNVPMRSQRARATLDELAALGLIEPGVRRGIDAVIEEAPAQSVRPPPALLHGDLYSLHVLVDEQRRPAGIIDWGDIHVGDRAVDLAIAPIFLPPAAHAVFEEAYGPIDPDTWRLARFRAVYHSASAARFAHAVGDRDLERESLLALRRTASPG